MNLTILKKIELYENLVDRARKGLDFAERSGNFHLFALNSRQIFKATLMQALILMRANMNAHAKLKKCFTDINNNSKILKKIDGKENIFESLPIERCGLVAFLLDFDFVVDEFSIADMSFGKMMDFYLLRIVSSNYVDEFKENMILANAYLDSNSNNSLQVLTYKNYFNILKISNSDLDKMGFIEKGFELFSLRKNDTFYSAGDQTEGGGDDNKIIVDYRLEVILKKIKFDGRRSYQ